MTFSLRGSSLALALTLVLGPGTALAQTNVSVLGLTSLEGDDEFARNLTGALRNAAGQVAGWTVSDRDVALSQMELTHDCASSDASCMSQIATTLGSARIVYGTIQRAPIGTRYEFQVTLYLFNAETGEIESRTTQTVPSSSTDIDALRDPARAMIRALSAANSPGTVRVSAGANLEVRIDDEVAGRTDGSGSFVSGPLPPGPHGVRVGDAAEREIEIAGEEVSVSFDVGSTGGDDGGGGGSILPYIGIGLLGVAAVSAGVWIYSMARLDALSNDAAYRMYREAVGAMNPMATTVCEPSFYPLSMGNLGENTCSEGATLEILQYVFLAAAVVSAGAGVALIVAGSGGDGESDDTAALRLRLTGTGVALDF